MGEGIQGFGWSCGYCRHPMFAGQGMVGWDGGWGGEGKGEMDSGIWVELQVPPPPDICCPKQGMVGGVGGGLGGFG